MIDKISEPSGRSESVAPIALFVYNRLDHTRLTLEALRRNALAAESDLIIFSDAARTSAAEPGVKAVRDYVKNVDGFKSIAIIERPQNLGLAKSVIDGITSICKLYGRVIAVEDDLVTSPHFLRYMNDALTRYEHEERVISIHGYIYPVQEMLPETYFLRGADCWGWATWARGWALFDADAKKLYDAILARGESREFDFDGHYGYTAMLRAQIEGRVNSWAILWHASAFLANKLTLYPGTSLVLNIGNDDSGTHSKRTGVFDGYLASRQIAVNDIPLEANKVVYKAISRYFASIRLSRSQLIRARIADFLSKWKL